MPLPFIADFYAIKTNQKMKNIKSTFLNKKKIVRLLFTTIIFLFFSSSIFSQDTDDQIILTKTIVDNPDSCNRFDVTLTITPNAPIKPQEVILVIDRSRSMSFDIPNDTKKPIDYALEAAQDFVEKLFDPVNNPSGLNKIAVVSYATLASLDIELTGVSGKQNILDKIGAIVTGEAALGGTNAEAAMLKADKELTDNGTFNCITSRSIIFLTDGVPTFKLDDHVTETRSTCPQQLGTACINEAIQAAEDSWVTIKNQGGTNITYNQNIYSIGILGGLTEQAQRDAAEFTLDKVQNSGKFISDSAADLTSIYDKILKQFTVAAKQIDGQSLITDVVSNNFNITTPPVVNVPEGTVSVGSDNHTISLDLDKVQENVVTVKYTIEPVVSQNICGDITNAGVSVMNYENSGCGQTEKTFTEPQFCVPCPVLTSTLARIDCTPRFEYSAEVTDVACSNLKDNFSWEFFLNDSLVGSSILKSGVFEYTGTKDLLGVFSSELAYIGTKDSSTCKFPKVSKNIAINLPEFLSLTLVNVSDALCESQPSGSVDITIAGGTPPFTYSWINTATNEVVGTTEDLPSISAGAYNVTITDASKCMAMLSEDVTIKIKDEIPPKPANPLEDISVSCDNVPEPSDPDFKDECPFGKVTETFEETYNYNINGSEDYEIVRTWTATDEYNNTTELVQVLTVSTEECIVYPCEAKDVIISKAVTPNGDFWNESFDITGIALECNFVIEVSIFNRWGALIYENSKYTIGKNKGEWHGQSHSSAVGDAGTVPNGTYYYIIKINNSSGNSSAGLPPFTGSVYLGTK